MRSAHILRLRVYAGGFCGALALHAAAEGAQAPAAFLIAVAVALGLAILAILSGRTALLDPAAFLGAAATLAVPLGLAAASASSPAALVAGEIVWPQVLVLVFASRILAATCEMRLAIRLTNRGEGGLPRAQSFLGASCLGLAFALLFYAALPALPEGAAPTAPVAVILRALAGPTSVHAAIVVLFFVVVAAVIDALLALAAEQARLARVRREGVAGVEALPRHSRVRAWLADAARRAGEPTPLDEIYGASRRFLRVLLSFLPLLGFLGTVIGLSVAVGAIGVRDAGAGVDLGGSLAGLAIQFETTLLGLLGGLLGSWCIALIDKAEGELEGECRRLAREGIA